MARKFLINILLVVGIVVVCDVLLAQIGKRVIHNWARAVSTKEYRVSNDLYHHDLKPNMNSVYAFGDLTSTFVTNSLGFRDSVIRDIPNKSSRYRIVLMGDSYTEGAGIEYPETFAGRIDAVLKKQGIEILNAGVASYAPSVYLVKLRNLIEDRSLQMDEVVLFLDLSDIWDEGNCYGLTADGRVENSCDYSDRPVKRFKNWLFDQSLIYHLYRTLKNRRTEEQKRGDLGHIGAVTNWYRAKWTVSADMMDKFGKKGLEQSRAHLDDPHRLLDRHGIALTLAVYPWPDQIANGDLDSIQVRYWRDWAAKNGVQFVNLFPPFFKGDPKDVIERDFIRFDPHYNANGHAVVAETFLATWRPPLPERLNRPAGAAPK